MTELTYGALRLKRADVEARLDALHEQFDLVGHRRPAAVIVVEPAINHFVELAVKVSKPRLHLARRVVADFFSTVADVAQVLGAHIRHASKARHHPALGFVREPRPYPILEADEQCFHVFAANLTYDFHAHNTDPIGLFKRITGEMRQTSTSK